MSNKIGMRVVAHGGIAGGFVLKDGTEVIVVTDNAGSTEAVMKQLKVKQIDRGKFHKVVIVQENALKS